MEFPIPGEGAAVAAARAAAAGSSSKAWHATDHPSKGGWGATLHNEDMLSAMSFSEDSTNTNNVEVSGIEGWAAGAEAVVAGAGNSDSMPGRVETIVL